MGTVLRGRVHVGVDLRVPLPASRAAPTIDQTGQKKDGSAEFFFVRYFYNLRFRVIVNPVGATHSCVTLLFG
jgi:hypothetical protein